MLHKVPVLKFCLVYLKDQFSGHYYNAYKCDLLYDTDDLDFASFADHITPYSCLLDMIYVLGQFKGGIDKRFDWF